MQQHHSSNHFHQQSLSLSSNFLPQKLAQPFNLLLRQKSEQNNISQFFVQYKGMIFYFFAYKKLFYCIIC